VVTAAAIALTASPASAASPDVVISQVYGGGGNSGATFTNDFVELLNVGSAPVDITGWSVQYASSGATTWTNLTSLCPSGPCFVQPGHYFLVQEGPGAGGVALPPLADVVGAIAMGAGAGKIALVATDTPLVGACPVDDNVVDFVGYGGANCAETTPTPALSNTTAAVRRSNGCLDTNDNSNDFVVVGPIPRNSTVVQSCGGDPTLPSGIGIATPSAGIEPSGETVLTVTVTPATTPPGTGVQVVADLTSIGGSASQPLFDDGTHGDATAGDNIFSLQTTVPVSSAFGVRYINALVTDAQSRTVSVPITLSIVSPTCGVERWAVKVGSDSTVGLVDLVSAPTPATVEELGLIIPPPETDLDPPSPTEPDGGQFFRTRSAPVETTVYTVDATITFYKKETDVDYHIVLDDGNGHTLISEIPSPVCILADGSPRVPVPSPLADGIARARAKFDARLTAIDRFQVANVPVRVKGVGFFDFEHGQTGVAPNAIELHPVLDISFRGATATTLASSENPTVYGHDVTFTATVGGGDGTNVPTGDVVFFDAGNSMTVSLDGTGRARFTTNGLTAGSHSISASYAGDDTSVPSVSATIVEVVAKADQTIGFAPLANKTFGEAPFTVSATGGASGNPVTFAAAGPCTATGANGSTITLTGIGTCAVTASQAGTANYTAAADVVRSFQIFDRTAPRITSVTPSVQSIWPPSGNMVPVSVAIRATDDVDPSPACSIGSVSSNEGTSADWQIAGPSTVNLRAARAGSGTGRIYTITVGCTDASGNASTAATTVTVPHDQGR